MAISKYDPIKDRRFWINENGDYHRDDGPAIEYADGAKAWFVNGKKHRIDGPAFEGTSEYKAWYIEGKEYTEEEFNKKIAEMNNQNPQTDQYGNKRWHDENGLYHRDNGPAIEYTNGDKSWWKHGQLHRLDGPAVDFINENKEWYIEDEKYTEEEFNEKIAEMKLPQIDEKGNKFWYNEKKTIS